MTDGVAVVGVDAVVAAAGAVAGVVVVGDADDDVKCYPFCWGYVAPFDSNRSQDGVLIFVMAVALHFVVSRDYEYFAYFLNDHGPMRHAIHLNGVYLNVLAVNGFAWDSKWARYLSNVSNCFGLEHFASYFGLMLCARAGRMLVNQLDVRHVHCDVLDDDVGWLKVNPEDCRLAHVNWPLETVLRLSDDANGTIPVVALIIVSSYSLMMHQAVVDAAVALPAAAVVPAVMVVVAVAACDFVSSMTLRSMLAISLTLICCCHYSTRLFHFHFE